MGGSRQRGEGRCERFHSANLQAFFSPPVSSSTELFYMEEGKLCRGGTREAATRQTSFAITFCLPSTPLLKKIVKESLVRPAPDKVGVVSLA